MEEIDISKDRSFLVPERLEGETYEAYKARRTAGNKWVKQTNQKLFWDSYYEGTFKKRSTK